MVKGFKEFTAENWCHGRGPQGGWFDVTTIKLTHGLFACLRTANPRRWSVAGPVFDYGDRVRFSPWGTSGGF
jgi:hypothetical protein